MRIDGDKSASVWDDRIKKLVKAALNDGCEFHYHDLTGEVTVTKGGEEWTVLEVAE